MQFWVHVLLMLPQQFLSCRWFGTPVNALLTPKLHPFIKDILSHFSLIPIFHDYLVEKKLLVSFHDYLVEKKAHCEAQYPSSIACILTSLES